MEEMEKKLTKAEIWYGFLRIPSKFSEIFPNEKGEFDFIINGNKTILSYHPKYRRIFGLGKWYKQFKAKEGTNVKVIKIGRGYKFLI